MTNLKVGDVVTIVPDEEVLNEVYLDKSDIDATTGAYRVTSVIGGFPYDHNGSVVEVMYTKTGVTIDVPESLCVVTNNVPGVGERVRIVSKLNSFIHNSGILEWKGESKFVATLDSGNEWCFDLNEWDISKPMSYREEQENKLNMLISQCLDQDNYMLAKHLYENGVRVDDSL